MCFQVATKLQFVYEVAMKTANPWDKEGLPQLPHSMHPHMPSFAIFVFGTYNQFTIVLLCRSMFLSGLVYH